MCFHKKEIERVFIRMYKWVKNENYMGYDPYDWGFSPLSNKLPYHLNKIISQVNLYSPINLRKIFRIKRGISNKSLALFAQAYLNYCSLTNNEEFLNDARSILSLLEKNSIRNENGVGWASYYFKFVRKNHILSPDQVDIIATSEALKAYSLAYLIFNDEKYKKIADEIVKLVNFEFLGKYREHTYIKYFPQEKDKIVFNVTGLVLSAFSEHMKYVGKRDDIVNIGKKLFDFLLVYQKDDGVWPYSYFLKENRFHFQIDYHQGFIIDGLVNFYEFLNDEEEKYMKVIKKGIKYYNLRQFSSEGYSYYRIPKKYPIDIHNQAQGIITFSNLYEKFGNEEYLNFALKIAKWSIDNMWDPSGYFYTHKWPIIINKIPYIRWGQAWMMVALGKLMSVWRDNNEAGNQY